MKMISTLAAAATMFAATSIIPVGAVTPAPLDTLQMSPAENVAMACRQVCRGGVCRERCVPGKCIARRQLPSRSFDGKSRSS